MRAHDAITVDSSPLLARGASKRATERAVAAEAKVEEERMVISQVREALATMEGQNSALTKEIEEAQTKLRNSEVFCGGSI